MVSGKSQCVLKILRCNAMSLYYLTAAQDRGGHRKRLTSGASLSHNPRIVSTTPTRTTIFSYPSSCTTTSASPSSLPTEVSDSAAVTPRSALSKSAEAVGREAVVEAGGGVVLAVIANIVSCSINIIKSMESNLSRFIGPSTKRMSIENLENVVRICTLSDKVDEEAAVEVSQSRLSRAGHIEKDMWYKPDDKGDEE
jgi:hypothetical protein